MEAFFLCNKLSKTDSSKQNGQQLINGSKKVHKQKPKKKEKTAVAKKRHPKTETKTIRTAVFTTAGKQKKNLCTSECLK